MAHEIIKRPEFGRTDMFIANYYASSYASEKAMIWNHFSHIVDAMLYLVGDMELLHADKIVRDEHRICYNMSFLTAQGAIGMIQSGFTLCSENPMERITVTGDGRSVLLENIRSLTYYRPAPERKYGGTMVLQDGGDALKWEQNYGQMSLFSYYGFEGCLENLVDAALHKKRPALDMNDGLKTIRILEDIEKRAVAHA
jgi:predicted dehydrogenase